MVYSFLLWFWYSEDQHLRRSNLLVLWQSLLCVSRILLNIHSPKNSRHAIPIWLKRPFLNLRKRVPILIPYTSKLRRCSRAIAGSHDRFSQLRVGNLQLQRKLSMRPFWASNEGAKISKKITENGNLKLYHITRRRRLTTYSEIVTELYSREESAEESVAISRKRDRIYWFWLALMESPPYRPFSTSSHTSWLNNLAFSR